MPEKWPTDIVVTEEQTSEGDGVLFVDSRSILPS